MPQRQSASYGCSPTSGRPAATRSGENGAMSAVVATPSQIRSAIAAPIAVNVGHMEITPTLQVPGGLSTTRPAAPQA